MAATLPLIREHGGSVSTRQIADAAGVAEGTIYRAFPDKDSLIRAALSAAFDPEPAVRRLARIDREQPFEGRITAAVDILRERLDDLFHLIAAFGMQAPPGDHRPHQRSINEAINVALEHVFAEDSESLRISAAECARVVRLFVFAATHPLITEQHPLPTDQIVDLLMHGVVGHADGPDLAPSETAPRGASC